MSELRKHDPIETPDDDPWKNDKLDRKAVADYLTPVIASIAQPFVISLHAPYGTGKTTFIKSWQADLKRQGFKTVYFNAWETDFSHDALSAFMVAFKKAIGGDEKGKKNLGGRIETGIKTAAGLVWRKGLPILVKGIARKVAGEETVKEALEYAALSGDQIGAIAEAAAVEALRAQEEAEKSLSSFKTFLGETVRDLTKDIEDKRTQKIIVFIDELDRCRPNYAVEVLEAIKHLFSVQGMVFILAIDDGQIKNSVQVVFGGGMEADEYLRKFIDWRFRLPEPDVDKFSKYLARHYGFSDLFREPDLKNIYNNLEGFLSTFALFARAYGLSLRQQEQCFAAANLVLRALPDGESPLSPVLGAMSVVHLVESGELSKISGHKPRVAKYSSKLNIPDKTMAFLSLENFGSKSSLDNHFEFWIIDSGAERLMKFASDIYESLRPEIRGGGERERQIRHRQIALADNMLGLVNSTRLPKSVGTGGHSLLGITLERIEGAAMYQPR